MSQSAAQADAFFEEVVRRGTVWTIHDSGGIPAPPSQDGQRAMPFWSSETRVRRMIDRVPDYEGFTPEAIPLEQWRERWLDGLQRDGLLVGVNWTGQRSTGYDLEPEAARARLDAIG